MFVFALKASWLDQQIMAVKEYNATQLYSRIFVILFNRAVALYRVADGKGRKIKLKVGICRSLCYFRPTNITPFFARFWELKLMLFSLPVLIFLGFLYSFTPLLTHWFSIDFELKCILNKNEMFVQI